MTTNIISTALCEFLEENVASKILLEKPFENDDEEKKLIYPKVFEGFITPNNYMENENENLPAIIVGISGTKNNVSTISITFAIFSYEIENKKMLGYSKLVHLISSTEHELMKNRVIKDKFCIEGSFDWEMYAEQPFPFWYATAQIKVIEYETKYENKFL